MATKYCVNCDRVVESKRQIGVGTFIMVLLTAGFWLLLIPAYSKRCPICKGTNFGNKPIMDKNNVNNKSESNSKNNDPMDQLKKLQELKESGVITEEEFINKKKKILETI